MGEMELSKEDLERLARKLGEIEDVLTPHERAVMLGIFGMASAGLTAAVDKAAQMRGDDRTTDLVNRASGLTVTSDETQLPTLSQGFKSSFVAGRPGKFLLGEGGISPEDSIGVTLGYDGIGVTWSRVIRRMFEPAFPEEIDIGPINIGTDPANVEAEPTNEARQRPRKSRPADS